MGIRTLGVSGSSGSSGRIDLSRANVVVAPGAAYELSRWTGYTLRHLSFSAIVGVYYPVGAIAITNRMPTSLHPRDLDPQALWVALLAPNYLGRGDIATFDFPPGLIWVAPGETLYVVVYDLVHSETSAADTGQWALSMLWEPYGR
jgi:hypothetical protein